MVAATWKRYGNTSVLGEFCLVFLLRVQSGNLTALLAKTRSSNRVMTMNHGILKLTRRKVELILLDRAT
jgi:hypothetical protein